MTWQREIKNAATDLSRMGLSGWGPKKIFHLLWKIWQWIVSSVKLAVISHRSDWRWLLGWTDRIFYFLVKMAYSSKIPIRHLSLSNFLFVFIVTGIVIVLTRSMSCPSTQINTQPRGRRMEFSPFRSTWVKILDFQEFLQDDRSFVSRMYYWCCWLIFHPSITGFIYLELTTYRRLRSKSNPVRYGEPWSLSKTISTNTRGNRAKVR